MLFINEQSPINHARGSFPSITLVVPANNPHTMTDFHDTAKIKSICDSLGSININVDEEEMVQVCLGNLAHVDLPDEEEE